MLDDKCPVLNIKIDERNYQEVFSLKDIESGLDFSLIKLDATDSVASFLEATHYSEKIPLIMLAQNTDDTLVFNSDIMENIMVIIDGYLIE